MSSFPIEVTRRIVGENGLVDKMRQRGLEPKKCISFMYEVCNDDGKILRLFMFFTSYIDFIEYYFNTPPEQRYFHEIIFSESSQKIRFDIDVSESSFDRQVTYEEMTTVSNNILYLLIRSLISKVKESFGIDVSISRDICIYESHHDGTIEKPKRSYHIVLNNYCLECGDAVKTFCGEIIRCLPQWCTDNGMVDSGIYKSIQNFRIVYSKKKDSVRCKTPVKVIVYDDVEYEHTFGVYTSDERYTFLLTLQESLITSCEGCTQLLYIYTIPTRKETGGEQATPDELISFIDEITAKYFDGVFPYSYSKEVSGYHILTRIKPSFCPLCKRKHDNENAYIVFNNGFGTFRCRRNPSEYISISMVKNIVEKVTIDEDKQQARRPMSRFDKLMMKAVKPGDQLKREEISRDTVLEKLFNTK